ncbi:MAG TPA: hypothetical protein VHZ07_03855 [Bryobacteraceae bacterium]|nr:hypothetical protein [Bryobacteraceae bacterium]
MSLRKNWLMAALLATGTLLTSCSPAPKASEATSTEAVAPAVVAPVTGKTAYWEMYASARNWAKDVMPLEVQSKSIPGVANEGGKAAMWTATFASPSQSQSRTFTYAIEAKRPDIYKGVVIGEGEPWSGPSRFMLPFQMSEVTVDTDTAYATAVKDAAAWLKEHPNDSATFTLRDVAKYNVPTWAVLFGDEKKGYRALVNAIDGSSISLK